MTVNYVDSSATAYKYKGFTFYGEGWTIEQMDKVIKDDKAMRKAMRRQGIAMASVDKTAGI